MAEQKEPIIVEPDDEPSNTVDVSYEQPPNSIIDKTVATQIVNDNKMLLAACSNSLTIVQLMGDVFERNEATRAAKPLALSIQTAGATIISARGAMRNSMQLIMEIGRYKPAKLDSDSEPLWNAIISSSENILESSMQVSTTSAKYFGLLMKLYDSVQYFVSVNRNANIKKKVPLGLSLKYLRRDCTEFRAFKNELDTKILSLTDKTLESMKAVIKSAIGDSNITKYQEQLKEWAAERDVRQAKLFETRQEWTDKIAPLQGKLVAYQVDRDALQVRINFAENRVSDLASAIKDCEKKADSYRTRAANATKSVPYTYTKSYPIRRTTYSWFGTCKRISYRTESAQHTGYKSVTDTEAQNRLYGAQRAEESAKANKDKEHKATQEQILEWTKHLEEDKKQITKTEEELATLTANEKEAVGTQLKRVADAEDKIKEAMDEIKTICKAAGQQENNVVDFLLLLTKLVPASMQSADGANRMNESIKAFEQVIARRTQTKLAIKDYFSECKLDGAYVKALEHEDFVNMEQLECDGDDYKEDLLPIYLKVNPNMKIQVKKTLKQFSTKPKLWKSRDKMETDVAREMLLGQFPALSSFFVIMQKRLDEACKFMAIEARKNKSSPLVKQFMLTYEKPLKPKLKIEDVTIEQKEKQKEKQKLIVSKIKQSKLECLDDEYDKVVIKVKSKTMQDKIKKKLKEGKKKGKDVKVIVLDKKILEVDFDSDGHFDGDSNDSNDSNGSDGSDSSDDDSDDEKEVKETLMVSSIKSSKVTCLDDEFDKVKFTVKSSKIREKIKKYLKKGEKKGKDTKIIVSKKKIGKKFVYKVIKVLNVDLAESSDESSDDSSDESDDELTFTVKKLEGSKLTCLDEKSKKIKINVKSEKMQNRIKKCVKNGKKLDKNVNVDVLQTKKGKKIVFKVLRVNLAESSDNDSDDSDDSVKAKKRKKKKRSKKTKKKETSSDGSESDSDNSTKKKDTKKGKKSKKLKKTKGKESSSDSKSDESGTNGSDSDNVSSKKKDKKKGKKDRKSKKSKKSKKSTKSKVSSTDSGSDGSEGNDETGSDGSDSDKELSKKKKKKKSKKDVSDESD